MKRDRELPGWVTAVSCGVIGVVGASAWGMRMEYARGEREWTELFQWGALPFGLPLGLVLGAVAYFAVAIAQVILHKRRTTGDRRPETEDKP